DRQPAEGDQVIAEGAGVHLRHDPGDHAGFVQARQAAGDRATGHLQPPGTFQGGQARVLGEQPHQRHIQVVQLCHGLPPAVRTVIAGALARVVFAVVDSAAAMRSVSSLVPTVMRMPSPVKARAITPPLRSRSSSSSVREPAGTQMKLASEGTGCHPASCRTVKSRRRSSSVSSILTRSWSSASREAWAAVWARLVTPNGMATLRRLVATSAGAIAKPTRRPARP